jgi:hypothetical protein
MLWGEKKESWSSEMKNNKKSYTQTVNRWTSSNECKSFWKLHKSFRSAEYTLIYTEKETSVLHTAKTVHRYIETMKKTGKLVQGKNNKKDVISEMEVKIEAAKLQNNSNYISAW